MSKKRKKRRRHGSRAISPRATNKHHILYQGRHWNTPYAKQLRNAFTRYIPIVIHNELHNAVLKDVPKPPERLLESAWIHYQQNRDAIDSLTLCKAILWLIDEIPDEGFRSAMLAQYRFFSTKMTP